MKKIIRNILFILGIFILTLIIAGNVNHNTLVIDAATSATSKTWAIDIRTGGWSPTQDAYLPEKAVFGGGLNKPSDIFIDKNDDIYIANSGDKTIAKYDKTARCVVDTISHTGFKNPKGIYITDDDYLYVADSGAQKIFVFTKNESTQKFEYLKDFSKPTSILYAKNEFKPAKIAVDKAHNMFVIGEGVLDGIIQLSKDGEFLGYFATNKVNKSLKEKMQELVYSQEILDNITSTQPPVFSNIYCDFNGLIYSTTSYSAKGNYNRVKKHNTSGKSLIDPIDSDYSPTDIYVGKNGIIYTTWNNGYITTYTEDGELLFEIGGLSTNSTSGLFTSLVSIAVDSNNNIWCLDDKLSALHQFIPTDYTNLVFEALDLYYKRNYEQSIAKWKEVLALNQVSAIAHNQLGLNYLYSQNYDMAMYHLKLAENRQDYSQAFWEVRNRWLQSNLVYLILGLVGIAIIIFVLHVLKVKKGIIIGGNITRKILDTKAIKDTKFNMSVLRHPYDSFYYIKTNKKGSTLSCFITMFVIFAIFLWFTLGRGFVFQNQRAENVDIVALTVGYFGIIILITFCNWLVSSIQDGEGTFLAVYRMVIVSLIPAAIALVVVTLLSYVATTNETFLLNLVLFVGIGLSVITFFLGVQNVHFYSFGKTIVSILLTILMIFVIILVALLVIILTTKLIQFIEILIKEVFR